MSHIPYNEKIGTECFGGSDYPTEEELATAQANRRSVADQRAYEAVLRGEPDIRPRCKHGYPLRGCCGIPGTPTTALEPDPLIGAWLVLDSSSVPLFVCGQTTLGMFYVRFADAVHQADARHKSELVCLRPATLIEVVKAKYAGNDRITTGVWNDGELCWGVMVDGAPVIYSANAGLTREAAANAAVLQCTGSDVDKALAHIDRALAKPAPQAVAVLTTTLPPDGSVAIGALAPSGGNIGATVARPAVGTVQSIAVAKALRAFARTMNEASNHTAWLAAQMSGDAFRLGRASAFASAAVEATKEADRLDALPVQELSAEAIDRVIGVIEDHTCESVTGAIQFIDRALAKPAPLDDVETEFLHGMEKAASAEVQRHLDAGRSVVGTVARPAVGTTHPFAVAAADGAAHPEANWVAVGGRIGMFTRLPDDQPIEALRVGYPSASDCEHGYRRGKCDLCELIAARETIARLAVEIDKREAARAEADRIACKVFAEQGELRAQLATVTKERDELRTSLDLAAQAVNDLAHGTWGSK